MDKIPLINPALIKVVGSTDTTAATGIQSTATQSTDTQSTGAENRSAPVLHADVVSSTRNNTAKEVEYKVVLKIGQKLIETVSPHEIKQGSSLTVKVLPGPELKIIANNHNSDALSANPRISPLIQQLLADRVPATQQHDAANLIKQLTQLLQSTASRSLVENELAHSKNPLNHTKVPLSQTLAGSNPTTSNPTTSNPAANSPTTNSQAMARQIYQHIQPASTSTSTVSSNTASINSAAKALSCELQQQINAWRLQLPNRQDISTSVGLKNALNHSGVRAEAQLSQLAAQSLNLPFANSSANSIFKQLQTLHQQAFQVDDKASPSHTHVDKIDLTHLVKKTAQTLADHTQQVLSGLLNKTPSSTTLAQPTASLATSTGVAWQNPLLNPLTYPTLDALLNDPLLQNPSVNNKFALSQILAQQVSDSAQTQKNTHHTIPTNWPERSGNDSALLRTLQNLLGHIEREQIHQRLVTEDNPLLTMPQQNSQWLPLLINHNHQFQLIEFYIEQEEKKNKHGEKKQQWSVNLHFELPKLGQLGIEITLFENECSTTFWSESSSTLSQLSQHIQPLRQRLTEQGILVNDLQSRHGILTKSQHNIKQRLVDINT